MFTATRLCFIEYISINFTIATANNIVRYNQGLHYIQVFPLYENLSNIVNGVFFYQLTRAIDNNN